MGIRRALASPSINPLPPCGAGHQPHADEEVHQQRIVGCSRRQRRADEFDQLAANFGSAERLASWVGICPGNNESAGKRKTGKTRKGNAWVRRLLCEFAQAASRSRCALKDKFAALSIRKGHKKSIVALAHKMLRIVFAVLKNKTPYLDKAVDYEAMSVQRNAPRWMKMLIKHGYMPTAA